MWMIDELATFAFLIGVEVTLFWYTIEELRTRALGAAILSVLLGC